MPVQLCAGAQKAALGPSGEKNGTSVFEHAEGFAIFADRLTVGGSVFLRNGWNDPYAFHNVNEERPDLVEKYTEFLETQWEEHQALAQQFTRGGQAALTPEQIRTLRALGYIR